LCILCAHRIPAAPVTNSSVEKGLFTNVTDFQRDILNFMKLALGSFDKEHQLIYATLKQLEKKIIGHGRKDELQKQSTT